MGIQAASPSISPASSKTQALRIAWSVLVVTTAYVQPTAVAFAQAISNTRILSELAPNGRLDPGEGAVLSVCFFNDQAVTTAPFSATVVNEAGISGLTGIGETRIYASLANNQSACAPFTTRVVQACGVPTNLSFEVNDGVTPTRIVRTPVGVGPNVFVETFDHGGASLPRFWTSDAGAQTGWTVDQTATGTQSPPARVRADVPGGPSVKTLVAPFFVPRPGSTLLAFSNYYDLLTRVDGGILEISINNAPFIDIVAAGGAFVQGGYNQTLLAGTGPYSGRQVWSGTGATTTILSLPAAAAGQQVRLRWLFTAYSNGVSGSWAIDSVYVGNSGCMSPLTTIPWGLQASIQGHRLGLTWQPPLNATPDAYVVEASIDGGATFPFVIPVAGTSLSLTTPDVVAQIRVRAIFRGVSSQPTNTILATMGSTGLPGQPSNLLTSVNGSAVTLSWMPPPEHGTIIRTQIEAGTAPGLSDLAVVPLPPDLSSVTVGGVPPGLYYLRVRTAGPQLTGAPSRDAVAVVPGPCASVPRPPVLLRASRAGGNVTLSWHLPVAGSPAPSAYRLEAGVTPSGAELGALVVNGQSLTVAPPPGTYHVRLQSVNSCGSSPRTPTLSFSVP